MKIELRKEIIMKKIKIISLVVVFMLLLVTLMYLISNKATVYTNDNVSSKEATINSFSKPQVVKVTYKTISRKEFLQYLAKSEGTNVATAIKIDARLTKSFEGKHPEFFGKMATQKSAGYYEYGYITRTVDMGPIYYEESGKGKEDEIRIEESVAEQIYVNGSFRNFVYVSDPFTTRQEGNYSWHQTYSHTFLDDHPIQFTAMARGYVEVAVNSGFQSTLGVALEGIGFSISYSTGTTYYYRKTCTFPTWTYSLYP